MPNRTSPTVAILCASGRSIYHHLPGVDVYDKRRGACQFTGRNPVIAHPPCRTWSKYLRHAAKPPGREAEQNLGRWAVKMVIQNGGVLEQPAGSFLWADQKLPMPNETADPFLFTIYVEQSWFGYATRKPTWLLISGVPKACLPAMPFHLAKCQRARCSLSSAGRSRTMQSFAEWLCQIARSSWWLHR